jgi:DNA-directed RNA polymerase specialized sigma24 family protein
LVKRAQGLTRKADLSRYKQGLTEKQELAFSLKYEYQVGPAELAARMGIDRKTAHEHIEAADRKIKQLRSNEKGKAKRAKSTPDNL